MIPKYLATWALAATVVVGTAEAALAIPLYAQRDTTIFISPDHSTQQLGVMPKGAIYEGYCTNNGWCFVDQPSGGDGWVWGQDLGNPPGKGGGGIPGFDFGVTIGGGGNGGGGGNNNDDYDDEFGGVPTVCFFDRNNYGGRSFCAEEGEGTNRLSSAWNDRISSIEVYNGATVEVCTNTNMGGTCSEIGRDTARLPSRLNDRISSFEVY